MILRFYDFVYINFPLKDFHTAQPEGKQHDDIGAICVCPSTEHFSLCWCVSMYMCLCALYICVCPLHICVCYGDHLLCLAAEDVMLRQNHIFLRRSHASIPSFVHFPVVPVLPPYHSFLLWPFLWWGGGSCNCLYSWCTWWAAHFTSLPRLLLSSVALSWITP